MSVSSVYFTYTTVGSILVRGNRVVRGWKPKTLCKLLLDIRNGT